MAFTCLILVTECSKLLYMGFLKIEFVQFPARPTILGIYSRTNLVDQIGQVTFVRHEENCA